MNDEQLRDRIERLTAHAESARKIGQEAEALAFFEKAEELRTRLSDPVGLRQENRPEPSQSARRSGSVPLRDVWSRRRSAAASGVVGTYFQEGSVRASKGGRVSLTPLVSVPSDAFFVAPGICATRTGASSRPYLLYTSNHRFSLFRFLSNPDLLYVVDGGGSRGTVEGYDLFTDSGGHLHPVGWVEGRPA